MNIYQSVIGQLLRHFLTIAASFLFAYGVSHEMQHTLVETTITVLVPIVTVIAVNLWSYLSKVYLKKLLQLAHAADPDTPIGVIETDAKAATKLLPAKTTIASILIVVMLATGFTTGCPKPSKTVREAQEASAKMSVYGRNIIQANIDAYKASEISLEDFQKLTAATGKFVKGVEAYRTAVALAISAVNAGASAETNVRKLEAMFNDEVVSKFLELTSVLNLIPGANSETVKSIVAGVRIAIATISGAFGSYHQYELRSYA